jgi:hypothetical protein
MTLLELYEKLCTGEIKLSWYDGWSNEYVPCGLCSVIEDYTEYSFSAFGNVFDLGDSLLEHEGVMTQERETFLLLFAAYKGEL